MKRCVCSVCFRVDLTIKTVMVTSSLEMETFSALLVIVREIHRSPVNSLYKGKWPGALMFSLICAWMNGWENNREAGDLRRHRAHYNITVMSSCVCAQILACHNYLRYPLFIYLCVWNYIHLKDLIPSDFLDSCLWFALPTSIFGRDVSGAVTDCRCGVWCRGLTIFSLLVSSIFGKSIANLGYSILLGDPSVQGPWPIRTTCFMAVWPIRTIVIFAVAHFHRGLYEGLPDSELRRPRCHSDRYTWQYS